MSGRARRGGSRKALLPRVLKLLRDHREGLSKQEVRSRLGTTDVTVQRVLDDLRSEYDAPLHFDKRTKRWRLWDASFTLPLEDPELDDVRAALLAEAMLAPLADNSLRARLRRLTEHLDEKVRKGKKGRGSPASESVLGWGSLVTKTEPEHLRRLLQALRRHPIALEYFKPWENETVSYTVEPHGVCIFDGAIYFRGYAHEAKSERTFRLAQVEKLTVKAQERVRHPMPIHNDVWSDGAPAFGIDHDRPGIAKLRIRGGPARWLHRIRWHPTQHDDWLQDNELLERTVAYNSVREMARRVLTILDGIVSIDPPELREQVESMIANYESRTHPEAEELPHAEAGPASPPTDPEKPPPSTTSLQQGRHPDQMIPIRSSNLGRLFPCRRSPSTTSITLEPGAQSQGERPSSWASHAA